MDLLKFPVADLMGWRGGVLAAVLLLLIYFLILVWRLIRLPRARTPAATPPNNLPAETPRIESKPELSVPAAPVDSVGFATQQFMRGVEAELEEVRGELAGLREQMAELREEIARLKLARNTSPHYAEAMALAQGGANAATVADRCGISLGEAELVLALSRQQAV